MADQKLTALSEISAPNLEDLFYTVDDPSGAPVSNKVTAARVFGQGGFIPGGRLTLTTGVAVTTADVTAAGTLFYTPYLHNRIRVWDGTRWLYKVFAEISLALTLTSGKNYDVFVDDDAATLVLSAAWTNDTTRADALGTQDSVIVLNSDKTKLWLGTIRASGANTTEDSGGGTTTQVGGKRFVWNWYNRVPRFMGVIDTTNSWSYTTNTIRQANGAAGNKVEYVVGAVIDPVRADVRGSISLSSNLNYAANVGVGVDATTAFSGLRVDCYQQSVTIIYGSGSGFYSGFPGLGYHYLAWCEKGADGSCSFAGDNGLSSQSGLSGMVMA